jgi:hypothetical protein
LHYDSWEECAVGLWTESSSQHIDSTRINELKSWYSCKGQNICQIAALKLQCGIVCNPPQKYILIIGKICSFHVQPITTNEMATLLPINLHKFNWILSIDCMNEIVQAVVSPMYQTSFASNCNRNILDVMMINMDKDELGIVVNYFAEQFINNSTIFRFVVDTESMQVIHVNKISPKTLAELYSIS